MVKGLTYQACTLTPQSILKRYPGKEQFTGGSACSGLYRGMMLWAAVMSEAGSLRQEDVIAALDHARIVEGPGGPAEMVPSRRHVRMNMYIAQAENGRFEIVESLGAIGPDETMEPAAAEVQPGTDGVVRPSGRCMR